MRRPGAYRVKRNSLHADKTDECEFFERKSAQVRVNPLYPRASFVRISVFTTPAFSGW